MSEKALAPAPALALPVARRSPSARRWHLLRQQPRILASGGVILLLILCALCAPLLSPYDPRVSRASEANQPPSASHWIGTDNLGRDMLTRVLWGARVSLSVGIIAVGIGLGMGLLLGLVAGWQGGLADGVIMRAIDALLAFPGLLLAIAITSALGPNLRNAMLAIGIVAIPVYTRLTRSQVLQLRAREYIEAARALGASDARIVFRHLLPNLLSPLIVQASLSVAAAILAEASLSFLGLGVQPPTPTWGSDINQARAYLTNGFWWMSFAPGVAIFLTVFSFNLLGDGIRDFLDPRLRDR